MMKADPRNEAKWSRHITAWEQSGQTRRVFCQNQGLSVHTFDYWRTRLNKKARQLKPVFIYLPAVPIIESQPQWIEVRLQRGAILSWQVDDFIELSLQLRALTLL